MKKLLAWFDNRTGIHVALHEALYENIPSGARLRYVTGSMLVFAFVTQVITGLILWMAYSPSSQTAWESVYFIQHQMAGGWFLRGVHHFMAQAMVVLLGMHMLQVVIDKAYKGPREVNFWLGLILMQLVLGLALTGYLLPWDQKGYWATNVATNLMSLIPFGIGEKIQTLVIGGTEYNHHTLTRFFAMHAGVLPALLVVFLVFHILGFRRHGITAKITRGRPDQYFWPHQVLLDGLACVVLVAIVVMLVIHWDIGGLLAGTLSGTHHGAELGAPADPAEPYGAARPEWYFLFLFQFLKYFHGSWEIVGAIVIPGAIMGSLFLMPFIGRTKVGHIFNVAFLLLLLAGAGVLTGVAVYDDSRNEQFQQDLAEAENNAERIHELVQRRAVKNDGTLSEPLLIPRLGAVHLMRNDPLTQGPKLFGRHCASCHDYANADGADAVRFVQYQQPETKAAEKGDPTVVRAAAGAVVYKPHGLTGSNLYGFASRAWIRGLLDPKKIAASELVGDATADPKSDNPADYRRRIVAPYFGNTAHRDGEMVQWVQKHLGNEKPEKNIPAQDVDAIVAALSAQAQLPQQAEQDGSDSKTILRGVELIQSTCAVYCHRFGDHGQLGLGPDLTGYGSYPWMLGLVSDPPHQRFYRNENDRMPSFAADLDHPEQQTVSVRELSLIIDWLRGDYYRADDARPLLPHSEEEADVAVRAARATDADLTPLVVGAPAPSKAEQLQARAEQIFTLNCSGCHNHVDKDGNGLRSQNPSAPNLFGFASREWLTGLLDPDQINGPHYFGNTKHAGGQMAGEVDLLRDSDDEQQEDLRALIIALSAEANLPAQAAADAKAKQDGTIEKGIAAFDGKLATRCADCHYYRDYEDDDAGPTLTNYGSREWLKQMISDPDHDGFYDRNNDRMPRFRQPVGSPKNSKLTNEDVDLLVRWLRGEPLDK